MLRFHHRQVFAGREGLRHVDHHGPDGLAFHIERFLANLLPALLQVGDGPPAGVSVRKSP
ncbi:hypothetical protein LNP26_31140 [Klebsiella variicola subsp. variicola]|nr:hypothetical protein [Klebsiella variicola subsp. variicola]